ncbi:MAG: hypothetical protein KF703_16800, partial [Actinobacteria bacterium]|nr:hypothetical protein [Actinomycetota bacterium]
MALLAATSVLAGGATGGASGLGSGEATSIGPLVVDVGQVVRPINRDLVGIHGRDDAAAIATGYDDLAPTTFRHVMSAHDFVSYDCATDRLAPATLAYFDSWLDAVQAEGADPILALSYVPPCYARGGQPKAPPTDATGYRRFLDQLLDGLVTQRVRQGKEPMRRFELWNEPDIPLYRDAPNSGHGFVGTVHEFVQLNLPVLAAAIEAVEARSGARLLVGAPAAYSPWPMSRYGATLSDLLVNTNGLPRATADLVAAQADVIFGAGATDRILHDGGLAYPTETIAAADQLGLHIDFVSVHLYPNNPLQGLHIPEPATPELLYGRSPYASPETYAELAHEWSRAFPGRELVLSEWSLAAGDDARFGTCEAASFDLAALSVMQETAIDRALYLSQPPSTERGALLAWKRLPAQQVRTTADGLPAGVWATAARDADRTTVLLSQWHTRLVDARDLSVPLRVSGLPDGAYEVTVERIGESAQRRSVAETATVRTDDGVLQLPRPVSLEGQSLARVDVRRAGTPA